MAEGFDRGGEIFAAVRSSNEVGLLHQASEENRDGREDFSAAVGLVQARLRRSNELAARLISLRPAPSRAALSMPATGRRVEDTVARHCCRRNSARHVLSSKPLNRIGVITQQTE